MLPPEVDKSALKTLLKLIEDNDPSSFTFTEKIHSKNIEQLYYNYRNELIYEAVLLARKLGYQAGFNVHTPVQDMIDKNWDNTWGVVANIKLPTGLVSWHIESPDIVYDGHGYEEKHERIQEFADDENRKNLADIIDKEHGGIYAYPSASKEDEEETRRLVQDYKKKNRTTNLGEVSKRWLDE